MDALGYAGGLVDHDWRVVAMNAAGCAFVAQELDVRDGRLVGRTRAIDLRLELLKQCLKNDASGVALVSVETSAAVLLRAVRFAHPIGRAEALITFAKPGETILPRETLLRDVFGFTAAEVAVALSIAKGQDLQDIANSRGVSVATVRSRLRVVFAKTGTRRQVSLAILIAGLQS